MEEKQFESKILFDQKIKYCGLKVNKDGFLMGRITPHLHLLVQENKYSKTDFDKYMAYLVPVKYTKKGVTEGQVTEMFQPVENGIPF